MASTTLKKITTRAKQLRKRDKKLTWKNAVKKAGAEYRAKKPVKAPTQYKSKTTGKWKNLTAEDKTNLKQLKKYKYQLRGIGKGPKPTGKPVVPATYPRFVNKPKGQVKGVPGKHTDTKSHNVNIRVVSGTSENEAAIRDIKYHSQMLLARQKAKKGFSHMAKDKTHSAASRRAMMNAAKDQQKYIQYHRAALNRAKKLL